MDDEAGWVREDFAGPADGPGGDAGAPPMPPLCGDDVIDRAELQICTGRADQAMALAAEAQRGHDLAVRQRAMVVRAIGALVGAPGAPDLDTLRMEAASAAGSAPDTAAEVFLYVCASSVGRGLLGEAERAARDASAVALSGSTRLRTLCDAALGCVAIASGDTARGRGLMPAPEDILGRVDPVRDAALVAYLAAAPLIWAEDYDSARFVLEEIDRRSRTARTWGLLAPVLGVLGMLEQRLCIWPAAAEAGTEALTLARASAQDRVAALADSLLAFVEAIQGRAAECRLRCVNILGSAPDPLVRTMALISLGILELGLGNYRQSVHWYEIVAGTQEARGRPQPAVSMWRADLAEAYIGMGRPDRARQVVADLEAAARAAGNERASVAAVRSRASLADDDAEADALFTEALVHYGGPRWRFARSRTQLAWGERLLKQGQTDAARAALRSALEDFEKHGVWGWAARAGELLERAGPVDPGPAGIAELDPEETQVALAAALGSKADEIAQALFMEPELVERHLQGAMVKLGLTEPSQLALLISRLVSCGAVPAARPADRSGPAAGDTPERGAGVLGSGDLPDQCPPGASELVTVRMLGGFELRSPEGLADLHDGITARAVKTVALAGKVPAEVLIEDLWPETEPSLGRSRLRSLMARLRRNFPPVIERTGNWIVLAANVVVDVDEFERLTHEVQVAAAAGDESAGPSARRAIDLYRGELLPGDLHLDFTVGPRERLKRRYLAVLDVAIEDACSEGRIETAVRHLEDALGAEPYDEALYLRAAKILAGAGRRSEALSFLRRAEHALTELGLPATATLELRSRL